MQFENVYCPRIFLSWHHVAHVAAIGKCLGAEEQRTQPSTSLDAKVIYANSFAFGERLIVSGCALLKYEVRDARSCSAKAGDLTHPIGLGLPAKWRCDCKQLLPQRVRIRGNVEKQATTE